MVSESDKLVLFALYNVFFGVSAVLTLMFSTK